MAASEIKTLQRWLARVGMVLCVIATVLATISAMHGNWILWAVNAFLFLVNAGVVIFNLQASKEN